MVKVIWCRYGEEVLVDDGDYDELAAREWKLDNAGYPKATVYGVTTRMHNVLLPPKKGYDVDHKDENKLNNQRSNLQYLTKEAHTAKSMRTRAERGTTGFSNKEVKKQIKREVSKGWQGLSQEELLALIDQVKTEVPG